MDLPTQYLPDKYKNELGIKTEFLDINEKLEQDFFNKVHSLESFK